MTGDYNPCKYTDYIFDLDGTLLDSKGDVLYYLEKTFFDFELPFDEKRLSIGPPLAEIIKILAPEVDKDLCIKIVHRFREYYNGCDFRHTSLYPLVKNTLETLYNKGSSLFVATNKPYIPTKIILDKFELTSFFSCIVTPDFFSDRIMEKTEMVQYLVNEFQLNLSKTLMIGDAVSDIQAGKSCGIDTAAYLMGYTDCATLRKTEPAFVFDDFSLFL